MFFLILGLVLAIDKKQFTLAIIFGIIIIVSTSFQGRFFFRLKRTYLLVDEESLSYYDGLKIKNKVLFSKIKDINLLGSDLVIETNNSKKNIVIPCYFKNRLQLILLLKDILYRYLYKY